MWAAGYFVLIVVIAACGVVARRRRRERVGLVRDREFVRLSLAVDLDDLVD